MPWIGRKDTWYGILEKNIAGVSCILIPTDGIRRKEASLGMMEHGSQATKAINQALLILNELSSDNMSN